jgi:hypothetical protein
LKIIGAYTIQQLFRKKWVLLIFEDIVSTIRLRIGKDILYNPPLEL